LICALALAALSAWWLYDTARRQGFHWQTFRATLVSLRIPWLLLASLCAVVTYYIRALRWAVLIRPVRPHAGIRGLFTATVIGFTAVTVFGRPGEFVRPYLIALREKVPFSSQLAAWLLERMFDLLIALVVFGYALGHVKSSGITVGPALSWVLAIGGRFVAVAAAVSLIVFVLLRHFSETMRQRLLDGLRFLPEHSFARTERLVNAFVHGVEATQSGLSLLLLTFYTAAEWVAIAVCYLCITRAFGSALHFGWTDVLIFMGFVSFGAVVQIPGIGGGVQVVTILVLTELFMVPLEVATSLALLLWIIMFVVIVPLGIFLAIREGLDWAKLRSMAREAEL
jgi:glycosyltransferase 2 family protein